MRNPQENSKDKTNRKKGDNRRYYLHRKTRELGFTLDSYKRTFYHPASKEVEHNKYLNELIEKFGYSLQYEIE